MKRVVWLRGLSLLFVLMTSTSCVLPLPKTSNPLDAPWMVVRVYFTSTDELNRWAAQMDVWEVDRASSSFVARVTSDEYHRLVQEGERVEFDCEQMRRYASALELDQAALQKLCPQE